MAQRSFTSDNAAGVHPEVLRAIVAANVGHALAYGSDEWTHRATKKLQALLGDCDVFFVSNGTGANVLGLSALVKPFEAVICAQTAHVQMDECGAFERFTGARLLTVPTSDGKLRAQALEPLLAGRGNQHASQPRVVSITNATELGTVYKPSEVRELATWCHERGLYLHCDGARIANAAAANGGDIRAVLQGVDVLSFGGTKNGLLGGEAVLFFDKPLARDFLFVRKQGMQLSSKMRFVAAQFDALLTDGLWLDSARHANRMAQMLANEAAAAGVRLARPTEANEVFALLPRDVISRVQAEWPFYVWNEQTSEVRWVCSWDTTEDDVRGLVGSLARCLKEL
ncbi:MAG: low specificity L-threonine aldolase [Candidatus Thermoplasmatota archaeon]